MPGDFGVQLANERGAPQLIKRVRRIAVARTVEPVGSSFHFRATDGNSGDLLGSAQRETAAHAGISGSRAGEPESGLTTDRRFAEGDAFRYRATAAQPALRLFAACRQFLGAGSNQNDTCRPN